MSNKKKILYFVEAMGGGVYTYIVGLTKKLADSFDIYVAYGIRKQTPKNFKEEFDSRVHLIEIKNFTRSISPTKDLKAYKELKEVQKRVSPDIIHLHSSKAGVLGRFAFRKDKIPVFYTPHGYSFLMADQSGLKRFVFKFVEKMSTVKNSQTISCSLGEHRETLRLTKNATYINNGIDIDELKKMTIGIRAEHAIEEFVVCTVGRVSYQKNPQQFNEIAKRMPGVKFVWIGDGELKSELNAKNIEITGWLNHREVLKKVIQSDVFILTSLWEGLPMSLLEAMYLRKLCVVSDVIGNHDVIEDQKNGFVCTTSSDFVNTIRNIKLSNSGLMDKIKESASEDINSIYNVETMAKKYRAVYETSLKE